MAFILHNSQSVTQSGVRTLSLRKFLLCVAGLCLFISVSAFSLGWFLGQNYNSLAGIPAPEDADLLKERFTFDKLGGVSGRLLALESEARALVKKLTALEMLESRLSELQSGKKLSPSLSGAKASGGASGGKVFAAQPCRGEASPAENSVDKIAGAEQVLSCLQDMLKNVEAAVNQRSVAYMVLPTKSPLASQKLGSSFGNRADPFTGRIAFHSGLDFEANTGAAILAAGAGKVRKAGWVSELGNMVEIDHGNGLVTRYAHSSKLHVKSGDVVTPGQKIAEVGSTGRSTGPHLHFEIIHDGKYVDPSKYLNIGSLVPNV